MSRKERSKKRVIPQDAVYNSILVSMLINKILVEGKKTIAQKIIYEAMINIKEFTKKNPVEILEKAIKNIAPKIELKSRRVRGTVYQIPTEIKIERSYSLAFKFLVKSARNRPGRSMILKIGNEIIDAYKNTGNAIKKKEDIYKKAEANKAFTSLKF